MSLSSRLARQVRSDVRGRGQPYFNDGSVRIDQGNATEVHAVVRGTEPYKVRLTRRGNTIRAWCSCPYFEDRLSTCKHIWATILAADRRGCLNARDSGRFLRLVEETKELQSKRVLYGGQTSSREDWPDEDEAVIRELSRRHEGDSPPRQHDDGPPRQHDDGPPRRQYDDDLPRRRYEDRPPQRQYEDDLPQQRQHDDGPPQRQYEDDLPQQRQHDDGPPQRQYEDDPPQQRQHDDGPPQRRQHDDGPPQRQYEDDPPEEQHADPRLRQRFAHERQQRPANGSGRQQRHENGRGQQQRHDQNQGRPPRQDGQGRPPRQDGQGRPPRQDGQGRPPRQDGQSRQPRQEGRPPRQDGQGRPPRQDGQSRQPRQDVQGRPPRQDGRQPRQDGQGRPPRLDGQERPPRHQNGERQPRHDNGVPAQARGRRRGRHQRLDELPPGGARPPRGRRGPGTANFQPIYIIDVEATAARRSGVAIELCQRLRKRDGTWTKPRPQAIAVEKIPRLGNPADQRILGLLNDVTLDPSGAQPAPTEMLTRFGLAPAVQVEVLRLMCQTGRCYLRRTHQERELRPVRWDDDGPWELWLRVIHDLTGQRYVVTGQLRRGSERKDLIEPVDLVPGGLVFWHDRVSVLQDYGAFDWARVLRQPGLMSVPDRQKDDFLGTLLATRLPRVDLPPELQFEEVRILPQPRLIVRRPPENRPDPLPAELSFDYAGGIVPAEPPGHGVYQRQRRQLIVRDRAAEEAASALLTQLGVERGATAGALELPAASLMTVSAKLLEAGWHVEAEGKIYRLPGNLHMEVRSGMDWFELHGGAEFGGIKAALPDLLAALERGDNLVKLGDGTYGQLPEEWARKYGIVAGLGTTAGDHLLFSKTQVGILDALLASQPDVSVDERFDQARAALRGFAGIKPHPAPRSFIGELRGYQREGLGWLHFLREFGFGGCLADDMGLGKTVMVLALLESRRALRARASAAERPAPSLAVVPKSLVFNWIQEASRFTPKLRVLDHTGARRLKPGEHFEDYDLILTTYGTLRRDAADFTDVEFDYCILDEAQMVKNIKSESAKAVRLVRCQHRLALSGTPVENHLGELWSLFDFLNPGMLGTAAALRLEGGWRNPSEETRQLLARALRPYILRRTKEQVAKDLPPKTEQTVYCDLEPPQRKLYDQLKLHYREALLPRIERDGNLKKSSIEILEALLRLRQAACHPGLIDKKKTGEPSAKLDVLREQLAEVTEEGHKALVFSQFTSLLAILREQLDADNIPYIYLDGRTRDRQARVEKFQSDADTKLFLISLKAGGLGLNLTAAEYVFLLDPWWNPAVEAQAIDRAHRIGQTEKVFAYRLIARDTVEEKILELQQKKRDLADAIINADNSLMRSLSREDLELLLS